MKQEKKKVGKKRLGKAKGGVSKDKHTDINTDKTLGV